MNRILVLAAFAVCLVAPGHAQGADHPSCAPWKAQWTTAAAGGDLGVMDSIIGLIPALCPALKAESGKVRADTVQRQAQEKQSRITALRDADPCVQPRNDWPIVQSSSEAVLTAYRDGLPAACSSWRQMADDRIGVIRADRAAADKAAEDARLSVQRQQQEAERQRAATLTAAAKAVGIEGRWKMFVEGTAELFPGEVYSKCEDGIGLAISDGVVNFSYTSFSGYIIPLKIIEVTGASVVTFGAIAGEDRQRTFTMTTGRLNGKTIPILAQDDLTHERCS